MAVKAVLAEILHLSTSHTHHDTSLLVTYQYFNFAECCSYLEMLKRYCVEMACSREEESRASSQPISSSQLTALTGDMPVKGKLPLACNKISIMTSYRTQSITNNLERDIKAHTCTKNKLLIIIIM